MDLVQRQRLTFLSAGFPSLQGLRGIPLGAMLILWALLEPLWPKSNLRDSAKLVSLILMIAGFTAIGSYYRRRFGFVERHLTAGAVLVVILGFGLYLLCLLLDTQNPPVSFVALLLMGYFVQCYLGSDSIRKHCLVLGLLLLGLALLPLTGVVRTDQMFIGRATVGNLALGIAFVVQGIFDHRILVRMLSTRSDDRA